MQGTAGDDGHIRVQYVYGPKSSPSPYRTKSTRASTVVLGGARSAVLSMILRESTSLIVIAPITGSPHPNRNFAGRMRRRPHTRRLGRQSSRRKTSGG